MARARDHLQGLAFHHVAQQRQEGGGAIVDDDGRIFFRRHDLLDQGVEVAGVQLIGPLPEPDDLRLESLVAGKGPVHRIRVVAGEFCLLLEVVLGEQRRDEALADAPLALQCHINQRH